MGRRYGVGIASVGGTESKRGGESTEFALVAIYILQEAEMAGLAVLAAVGCCHGPLRRRTLRDRRVLTLDRCHAGVVPVPDLAVN